jgi:hypothetical protein
MTLRHALAPDALLRLALPRPAAVELDERRLPLRVDGRAVESVLGRWVVEEGWWTDQPVRRAYSELLLEGGRLEVVFEDLVSGEWCVQRA